MVSSFCRNNTLKLGLHVLGSILLIGILVASIFAQGATDGSTPLALSPGSPAGSYALSDAETVNLFNGSVNFSTSLLRVNGRGGAAYPLAFQLHQKWTVQKYFEPGQPALYWAEPQWWSEDAPVPFRAGRMQLRQGASEEFVFSCNGTGQYIHRDTLTRITFTAPDGTEYELRDQLTNGQPAQLRCATEWDAGFNRGRVFVTADGTSATFVSDGDIKDVYYYGTAADNPPTGYLMLRDGTRFRVVQGKFEWMRDRNGNKLTFTYDSYSRLTSVTDSINRQITMTYGTAWNGGVDEINFKGFGGANRTIRASYTLLENALRSDQSLRTYTELFPELNYSPTQYFNPRVYEYLELPDGRRYQFKYNSYGELARMVLPTGGAAEYDYAAGLTNGAASGYFTIGLKKHIYRRVIERRLYPDGGMGASFESKTTYSRPETSTSNLGYVTAEQRSGGGAPLGLSHHYFHGSARASFGQQPYQYPAWQDGRQYQTDVFDTNGTTVLRRVTNSFDQRAQVGWWGGSAQAAPPNDVRLTETVTTIEPSGANLVSKQTFGYDDSVPFNNQNNVKEYDFGSGTPAALLRETRTTFVTSTNYTGTDVHLRSLPEQISVHNGSGVPRAKTIFEYDTYAGDLHAPLEPRSNISGQCDGSPSNCPAGPNFGDPNYLLRGNVTESTQYSLDSAGNVTGSISGYSQYDVAGNVVKLIDPRSTPTNVIATSFDFSDRFGSPDAEARSNSGASDLAGKSSFAFPTLVTNVLGHTAYTQIDYYLGRPVDGEDPNGSKLRSELCRRSRRSILWLRQICILLDNR